MYSTTVLVFAAVLATALKSCISGNALLVAHNVTIEITCTGETIPPSWIVNGTAVGEDDYSYRSIVNGRELTATLMINGNRTCDPLNVVCKVFTGGQLLSRHNTNLTFQDPLPPPENVNISEHLTSLTIEWKPPFSTMNNDTIRVDPHITQYTVYITDNYTGISIVEVNVTETRFTSNISQFTFDIQQDDRLCLVYQISACNAGGEGQPVQDSILRVPRSIAAENIALTATSDTLQIHIENVDVVCTSRLPEFFLITVLTSAGRALNETTRQHQPGEATADFNVNLSQFADVCTLHVRIRAGNSAGMSTPSETVQVVCQGGSIESTTTSSATTVSIANGGSESGGNGQPRVNTTSIAVIIGACAATGGVLIVVIAVMIMCYRKFRKNSKVDHSDRTDNEYSKNPSPGGLYTPEADYVTTEGTTSRPVAQDPESTATKFSHSGGHLLPSSQFPANRDRGRTQSSNSTESTDSASSSSSTGSGGSRDLLLRPSSPASAPSHTAPAKSPQPLYAKHAQLNVKQTQVPPPANDDHVQYAEIDHRDKM